MTATPNFGSTSLHSSVTLYSHPIQAAKQATVYTETYKPCPGVYAI